jgi:hypothetical protein
MPIMKPGSHRILKIVGSCSVQSLGYKVTRRTSTSCNSHINNWGLCSMSCPALPHLLRPTRSPGWPFLAMLSP